MHNAGKDQVLCSNKAIGLITDHNARILALFFGVEQVNTPSVAIAMIVDAESAAIIGIGVNGIQDRFIVMEEFICAQSINVI
jgi:hypothetical protein